MKRANTKYGNRRCFAAGKLFDSRGEAEWYLGLELRQRAGEIRKLRRQERIVLQPSFRAWDGKLIREIAIVPDASYEERVAIVLNPGSRKTDWAWIPVIADFKSPASQTPAWKIKWKMLQHLYAGTGVKFEVAEK